MVTGEHCVCTTLCVIISPLSTMWVRVEATLNWTSMCSLPGSRATQAGGWWSALWMMVYILVLDYITTSASVLTCAGLQRTHPDLNTNFVRKNNPKLLCWTAVSPLSFQQDWTASLNTVDGSYDPSPSSSYDNHGTSCGGIIAMEKSNDHCGVGVAHHAKLGGQLSLLQ